MRNSRRDIFSYFAPYAGTILCQVPSPPLFLFSRDRLGRSLAGSRVRVSALSANR